MENKKIEKKKPIIVGSIKVWDIIQKEENKKKANKK